MLKKKNQEKSKLTPELKKIITEIPITNGHETEPFVKVFNYSDKNIAKSSLGSLIGVFEVSDKDEDSVFIVNFLTSVAKTEYFNNVRRGSIESFEAALHKINLALAELVKDGHIAWLGKFHGALGVLEKNNFHFSVTGKAQILLLRNGNLSEISEGLASPESNAHPIKTFVEISSGRLVSNDKIILTSPELFDLLTPEDLEKNSLRMEKEQFAQFLRTVLVNKLDMGGSLIVDFQETKPLITEKKEAKKTSIEATQNFFSQEAFEAAQRQKNTVIVDGILNNSNDEDTLLKEEYIDPRSGHIYIQGDTEEQSKKEPSFEKIKVLLQDMSYFLNTAFSSQKKSFRKNRKNISILFISLGGKIHSGGTTMSDFLSRHWKKGIALGVSKIASFHSSSMKKEDLEQREVEREEEQTFSSNRTPIAPSLEGEKKEIYEEIPFFIKDKLTAFYQKEARSHASILPQIESKNVFQENILFIFHFMQRILRRILFASHSFDTYIRPRIQSFSKTVFNLIKIILSRYERKTIIVSLLVFILFIFATSYSTHLLQKKSPPAVVIEEEAPRAPAFPLETEKNAHLATNMTTLFTTQDTLITSVILGNEKYIVTSTYILGLSENKKYSLPSGMGAIALAVPMNDLRLIFVYTDKNELISFAPSNHTFTKNTLLLPENVLVKDIGTYLTYLYTLDKTTGQVYRFPRAEGGFGVGTAWLKKTLVLEDTAHMSINETVFIAPNKNILSAFFRGQFVKNIEAPFTPLSITNIFTSPEVTNVYALDTANKRVLIWNKDGVLLAQYFSEQFANAKSITANEKTNEIFFTTSNNLLSFTFNLEQ